MASDANDPDRALADGIHGTGVRTYVAGIARHVQLGIDPPRQLQGLDSGVGLSEPHEDVASAGKAMGIIGIDRDRAVHLRLSLLVLLMENMDTAENDVRTHI